MGTLASAPAADELEVSLFGPGVGECVVVHAGGGTWLVVDSCVEPGTHAPAALTYLSALGVPNARAVTHVIVSHWHDDHTRGISRVLEVAEQATLVCSSALRRSEFQEYIAASRSLNMKSTASSGVDEITASLQIVRARRAAGARTIIGPEWAQANTLLFRRPTVGDVPECEVFALSPSSETMMRGLYEIAELLPKAGTPKRAAVNVGPNDTSLVVSVRLGSAIALLGSDLENGVASPGTGWAAILTTTARPSAPSQVFKVPHHGSENAYHPGQWSSLLTSNAFAIMTPYASGRKSLPSEEDIARLKAHTKHVYCTAPRPSKASFQDTVVQRTIGEVARVVRPRLSRMGHIRIRMSATNGTPAVELFGAAFAA